MDIRKTYVIDAPADAVRAALTDPAVIERWGGGPAVMAAPAADAADIDAGWDDYYSGRSRRCSRARNGSGGRER